MVVGLQYISGCGKRMIKVRQKYVVSKAHVHVWLRYGKSTVMYGNGAYCKGVRIICLHHM